MSPLLLLLLATTLPDEAASEAGADAAAAEVPAAETPDRTTPPPVTPPVPLELPQPTRHTLKPGVVVEHLRVPGVRKVQVNVLFHRGSVALCGSPAPACTMLSQLWDVAGEDTDATTLEAEIDRLDGSLTSWVSRYDAGFDLVIPRAELPTGLARLEELLYRPSFPRADLKRTRRELTEWYTIEAPNDLSSVAALAQRHALYPPDHPRGTRPDLRALKGVSAGDVRAVHQALLATAPVTVQVVGDLAWADVEADLAALLSGVGVAGERATPPPYAPLPTGHVVAVDMPGQAQAAIRLTVPAPAQGDPERVAMQAVNFALGGSFTSRLNGNLREEKGWTYGAYSRYSATPTHGTWLATVDVEAENVAAAAAEIQAELGAVVSAGVTEAEVSASWLDVITWWNRRLETDQTAADFYQRLTRAEEDVAALADRNAALRALSPADAQAAASTWLGEGAPQLWVVVGDRAVIGEQVTQLGPPVTWLTAEEAIMGTFTLPR